MNKYKLVKFVNDNIELNVNVSPEEDTVWLKIEDISHLFDRDRSVISKHIKNIFSEKELCKDSSVHFLHIAGSTKPVKFFNLDVIISIGYRIKSQSGIIFRKWANKVLKEYLLKGYAISHRSIITKDNYISLVNKVTELDKEVNTLKREIKLIKPNSQIFYSGQYYDSYSFVRNLLKEVISKVIIIDPYMDDSIFDYIKTIKKDIAILLIYSSKTKLTSKSIEMFKKQYFDTKEYINDSFHDRFIIIDDNIVYHLGTSLNYLGKKTFVVNKITDSIWIKDFIRMANKNEK